jgi:hypothetical protein
VDHLKLVMEAAVALRAVDMTPVLAVVEEVLRGRVVVTATLVTTGNPIRLTLKDVLFQMKFVRDV